jgi:predicted CopG family antitoxin
MDTLVVEKKKKNIDIPINIFQNLSMRAVSEGKSLKSYIENLLVMEANTMTDEELYHYLVKNKPQGNVYLNEIEQKEFENWLGI